ncbi:hypothetical protein VPH35_023762 [Triticum aestivum]
MEHFFLVNHPDHHLKYQECKLILFPTTKCWLPRKKERRYTNVVFQGASGTSYVRMNHQLKGVIGKKFVECNGKAKNNTPWRSNSKIRQEQIRRNKFATAYGFFVDPFPVGSDHTCEGNQVGLDAPFIRNVDENYPSSPANYSMITAVNIDKSTSIGGVLTTFEEVVIMVVVVEEVVGAGGIITEQAPSSP